MKASKKPSSMVEVLESVKQAKVEMKRTMRSAEVVRRWKLRTGKIDLLKEEKKRS